MTIEEIMTRRVITVRPETPVQEAAKLMFTNHVSGLPVIDTSERVVGVISDGDLILRQRRPKVKPWWRLFFESGEQLVRDYKKIVGMTVAEVMTQPALVIDPAFGIETAAAILDNRQIRRLPVVRDGRLVGIVSRGDLIRALAGTTQPPAQESLISNAPPPEGTNATPRSTPPSTSDTKRGGRT
jgi:CBS domain-containing protein